MSKNKGFENRASTGKISSSNEYLEGTAIVFDSVSEVLAMKVKDETVLFREQISKNALDNCPLDRVICCADHDESIFLGIAPKTLELNVTDRGLDYKCLLPPSKKQLIEERVNRGEYEGNSFRFAVTEGGDTWEKMPDGTYLRTINQIGYIGHVGPVFNPAYTQTDLQLAQRSFEVCINIEITQDDDKQPEGEGEGTEGEGMQDDSVSQKKELLRLRKRKVKAMY